MPRACTAGLALIAIQQLRKRRLRCRIGLAGGEDAAPTSSTLSDAAAGRCSTDCNQFKLLFNIVARRPHETPHPVRSARRRRQSVLEPRARHGVDRGCRPGRGRSRNPQCRPLHSGYAIRKPLTGSAQPAAPLPHAPSLEHVRDHQNRWQTRPLSRRAKRRSSAAPGSLRKKYAGIVHPKHGTLA